MASAATSPGRADSVRLFISYAHEDESLLRLLNQHLAPLRQQGLIKTWHDRAISPGTPWEKQLLLALNEAEVVVLIVTPDFIDSTYIRDVELRQVLERQKDRFVRIVPVIGRFSSWEHVPELSSLQVLPKDGKPVSVDGRARERLLKEAAEGIIQVVREVALDRQVIGNAPERSVPGGPRPDSPRQTNISKQPHSSTDVQKSAQAQSRRRLAIWSSICILIGAACIAALSHISKPDSDNISAVDLLERGKDLYKLKKYVAARPQFVNAGQRGSGEADDYLGLLYRDGLGVSKDYRAAKKWFSRAAARQNSDGMNHLGLLYESGSGTELSFETALAWFKKASKLGNGDAMNNLGWMYLSGWGVAKDTQEALSYFQNAAGHFSGDGMNNLGWLYQQGLIVPQDHQQAFEWFKKGASKGSSLAMNSLGWMFLNGLGRHKDPKQAIHWFEDAANRDENLGSGMAMNNLGWVYEKGLGVTPDRSQAVQWYQKALEKGNHLAKLNLEHLDVRS